MSLLICHLQSRALFPSAPFHPNPTCTLSLSWHFSPIKTQDPLPTPARTFSPVNLLLISPLFISGLPSEACVPAASVMMALFSAACLQCLCSTNASLIRSHTSICAKSNTCHKSELEPLSEVGAECCADVQRGPEREREKEKRKTDVRLGEEQRDGIQKRGATKH